MAEIRDGKFVRNETNQNSFGGTERMTERLAQEIDGELLNEFQIVSSRVRDLQDDKIRIFWAHDLPGDPESNFLKDKNEQNKFHKFVFVSNWQMQGYIDAYDIPWSKCVVLKNAIDVIEPHTKPDHKKEIRLVYTSTPHRGLNILIPVFEKLCEKYDNIHLDVFSSFKIYGWEQRDEIYKEMFDYIEKHEKMTYHGTQPNEVVREALKQSHIFAYPSVWRETSCLSLMEAMSAGLVCVHPNYGALAETSANWTHMYQYHEDVNRHAQIFYGILDLIISEYGKEEYDARLSTAKQYVDVFYSWQFRQSEWTGLLLSLKNKIEDRSIPSEQFIYSS
jgi:glycosyltransferase involved in cell wall biosynthesis